MKQKNTFGVNCDREVPLKLEEKIYCTTILLGGKQPTRNQARCAKMRMLRWISKQIRQDRFRNESIREKVRVTPFVKKIEESYLTWFRHV